MFKPAPQKQNSASTAVGFITIFAGIAFMSAQEPGFIDKQLASLGQNSVPAAAHAQTAAPTASLSPSLKQTRKSDAKTVAQVYEIALPQDVADAGQPVFQQQSSASVVEQAYPDLVAQNVEVPNE